MSQNSHHININMLEDIQKQITIQKPKMKQKDIVQICLNYISVHPEDINVVGIAWYDNCKFIINTKIFAAFTKRKINTINRNFRKNGFKCYRTNVTMRERQFGSITFSQLSDSKNWVIHHANKFIKKSFPKNNSNIFKNDVINEKSNMPKKSESIDLLFDLNDESYGIDYCKDDFNYYLLCNCSE